MTIPFHKGHYTARFAASARDVGVCQRLRHQCFFGRPGVDADRFDLLCRHLMIENEAGRLVATVRLFEMASGAALSCGYAAQYYDLRGLAAIGSPMIEIGRFCVAADVLDADVLRVAWGHLTQLVDRQHVGLLFGCTSFAGTDAAPYGQAFAQLARCHLGPDTLRPGMKACETVRFAQMDHAGTTPMPSLLRTYLAMGGWVGDHAVIDRSLNTMHVFTCLEVAKVPPARARALRALAQDAPLS